MSSGNLRLVCCHFQSCVIVDSVLEATQESFDVDVSSASLGTLGHQRPKDDMCSCHLLIDAQLRSDQVWWDLHENSSCCCHHENFLFASAVPTLEQEFQKRDAEKTGMTESLLEHDCNSFSLLHAKNGSLRCPWMSQCSGHCQFAS